MQVFVCRLEPDPREQNQWGFTLKRASDGETLREIREKLKVLLVPKKYFLLKGYMEQFCFLMGLLRV